MPAEKPAQPPSLADELERLHAQLAQTSPDDHDGYLRNYEELADKYVGNCTAIAGALRAADAAPTLGTKPPTEVRINTRGCEPMTPEAAGAVGEAIAALAENYRRSVMPPTTNIRNNMLEWTPAELAIHEATQAVEAAGADVLLTDAVNLLGHARQRVAMYVQKTRQTPVAAVGGGGGRGEGRQHG